MRLLTNPAVHHQRADRPDLAAREVRGRLHVVIERCPYRLVVADDSAADRPDVPAALILSGQLFQV